MPTLICLFVAALPLVVIPGNDDAARLPQSIWLQIGVLFLWTVHLSLSKSPGHPAPVSLLWSGGAFLSWSALSMLWAINSFSSHQTLFLWIAATGLAWLILRFIDTTAEAWRVLRGLFGASVVVAGIGLLQHLAGLEGIPQAFPPAGTMGNKNVAAAFVALLTPVGVVSFARATTGATLLSMATGLSLAFVAHTGCRAAALALLAQTLIAAGLFLRQPVIPRWAPEKWAAMGAGVALFAVLLTARPAGESVGTAGDLLKGAAQPVLRLLWGAESGGRLRASGDPPSEKRAERSVAIRLGVWRNTLEMVRSAPLAGVGIGNFPINYPRFARSALTDETRIDERVESAHNDYVQLVAELGLIGAALLGWLAVMTTRALVAAWERSGDDDRSVCLATSLGLVGALVCAIGAPTVNQPGALAAAATFVGVGVGRGRRAADRRVGGPEAARPGSLSLAATAAILVMAGFSGLAQIRADRHVLRMAQAEVQQDWEGVVSEGLLARRFFAARTDPRFGVASAMLRLGQTGAAAEMLRELISVDPNNANALGNLGMAYEALGDPQQAAACFERVLLLRPGDPIAQTRLSEVRKTASPRSRSGTARPPQPDRPEP